MKKLLLGLVAGVALAVAVGFSGVVVRLVTPGLAQEYVGVPGLR
jgi:hypothetical protein